MAAFTTVQDLLDRDYTYVPDGVYFDLPDELYFEQEALGSSDLIRLWKHKHGWWWQSRYNPDRVERVFKERAFGHGAHAIICEGLGAYEQRFAIQPTCPPGALLTAKDCQEALRRANFALRGTSGWVKEDWYAAVDSNLPNVPCWPNMLADFDVERGTRPVLSAVQDRMLRIMHRAAMADPGIAHLFGEGSGFPPLAEVAVLKTDPTGVRRRWKFDRLFPAFTLDLKTLGNWEGRPLQFAVGDHIGRGGYDIQRADYDVGRGALYDFVRDGFQVYGGSVEQRHFLKKMVEGGGAWDWVWLFYQKPEPTGRAPVIFPVYDDNESELKAFGRAKAVKALSFYREAMAKFGAAEPWTHVEPLHYTAEGMSPRITLPHWVSEDEPPEDAAAYDQPDQESAYG